MFNSKKQLISNNSLPLFSNYGVQVVSMDDVANRCGISKKTLYKEFDSKEDLLNFIIENEIKQCEIQLSKVHDSSEDAIKEILNFLDIMRDFFKAVSPLIMRDLMKYYIIIYSKVLNIIPTKLRPYINKNIKRGIKEGLYKEDISNEEFEDAFVGFWEMIFNQTEIYTQLKYKQTLKFFFNLYIYGLLSTRGLVKFEDFKNRKG
ncbi:MAG: TetR/AcrR family transcriptional regulator [Flavobacteriaceae bacterium]|nr:TetR/AcrR family transcriptional regulator [Flavobacteriaceae bacterium]